MVDDEQRTRYAYTLAGQLCHAEAVGGTRDSFVCAVCGADILIVSPVGGDAYFRHSTNTTCTGRLPFELAPDLIAELGDKPWWISFNADWQAANWTARLIRLTWSREGYLPDAEARCGNRRVILTGAHTPDPVAAIESVHALLDDIPRRLMNRRTIEDPTQGA